MLTVFPTVANGLDFRALRPNCISSYSNKSALCRTWVITAVSNALDACISLNQNASEGKKTASSDNPMSSQ